MMLVLTMVLVAACGHGSGRVSATRTSGSSTTSTSTTTTTTTSTTRTTATSSATSTTSASAVRGTVTAGPTCPVERPDQPCPPQPVSAEIDAIDRRGVTVARTTSDDAGRYDVAVAPGAYTLHVNVKSQYPRCPDTQVTVRPGETATADISCDTGIR